MTRPPRHVLAALSATALVAAPLVAVAVPAAAEVSTSASVVVQEVYGGGGNSGAAFNRDFVELRNTSTGTVQLDGWAVQYASAAGASWQVTSLTGSIAAGDTLLVGMATGANTSLPGFEADVEGTTAMSGTQGKVALTSTSDALTCGTGCASVAAVVDLVGYGAASSFAGSAPAPGTSNGTAVTRDADGRNTADNLADFVLATPTPQPSSGSGEEPTDPPTEEPTPTQEPTDPSLRTIPEIQGTGAASPLVGQTVTTRGVVTAAYPTGGLRGYVIQTPGSGGELTDAHTASEALFVFSEATVGSVAIGDHVQVTGAVVEFEGLTELSVPAGGLTVLTEAAEAVKPAVVTWPATDAEREVLESMLLAPQGDFTVSNTYSTHQYGELILASGDQPLLQPTDVARPGTPEAAAVVADNAARQVRLDDGATTNYLSSANTGLTPPYVSLTAPVRVGAPVTFTSDVVLGFRNNQWTLDPVAQLLAGGDAPATFGNTRTAAPEGLGDAAVTVAAFNVLNYFTTLGNENASCVAYTDRAGNGVTVREGCDQRGAWTEQDLARQQEKLVAAINATDADVVGLMEIESSARLGEDTDEALAALVAALNAATGETTWAFVPSSSELPPAADLDVISNAIIYQPGAVEPVGDSRALGTQSGPGAAFSNAREPIAQTFEPVDGGESVTVVVNHFKSKSASGSSGENADKGDGQGAWNADRIEQATALAAWVSEITEPTDAVALVGDFNSYTAEDPLEVLYQAGYVDAARSLGVEGWSYSFSGLSGSLDHVLLNEAAAARATGADIWEINAGESVALEYSRYNAQGSLFHDASPYRSSDHDPVIVGLSAGDVVPTGVVDLTLLDINDFHGRIDGNTVAFAGTVEEQRAAVAAAGGHSLFLSAGDNIGASLFASSVADDQPTIDVLNALDLAASAVGNHEFDQGFDDLVNRVVDGGANAAWAYLGANVYGADGEPALPEYSLHDVGGVDVAVIGVVTQETPSLVSPGGIEGLTFGDPVEAVNRVAAQLTDGDESNGEAQVIVAAYHEGAGAGTPDGATLEEELAAGGAFAELVTQSAPAVDVIFTGHTHKQYAWIADVEGSDAQRPVLQTGSYGEFLGRVDLTYDPATDVVTLRDVRNVPRTTTPAATLLATYPAVVEVKTIVDAALVNAAVIGEVPVARISADITTAFAGGSNAGGTWVGGLRDDRSSESTLGGLVADSLVASLGSPDRGAATIGIVNPGGMRNELYYAKNPTVASDADGVVSYAEANAVLPFVNNLWTTTLTGEQLLEVLEQQWQTTVAADGSLSVPSRPYLQLGLSSNVTYTFDADPDGDGVLLGDLDDQGRHITSVTIDGEPLDPAAEYRIGSFSFLLQGGDNFRALIDGTSTRDSGLIDRDAWIAYLSQASAETPISPDFARQSAIAPELGTVTAGEDVSFDLGRLDLTSLGAPANTTVAVQLDGTELGSFPVTAGAASVTVTIPAGTAAGTTALVAVAQPSGTTVTLPLTVEANEPVVTTTTTLWLTQREVRRSQLLPLGVVGLVQSSDGTAQNGRLQLLANGQVYATIPVRYGLAGTLIAPRTLPVGTYQVTARFIPAGDVEGSTSAPVQLRVR